MVPGFAGPIEFPGWESSMPIRLLLWKLVNGHPSIAQAAQDKCSLQAGIGSTTVSRPRRTRDEARRGEASA